MLWEPMNLTANCPAETNITACSHFAYVYLDLLVRLFGGSDKPSAAEVDDEEFDFIVVGAGTAGCIVANRLSAIQDWKVLLVEAGCEEPEITQSPALAYALQGSNIDWQYKTQPDGRSCLSREGQQCSWPRGKVMGGSSSINSLAYVRGSSYDYDNWASMGNHGWSYKEVLPFFIKSEQNQNIESVESEYHGVGGEQVVSDSYLDYPSKVVIDGLHELGLPIRDINGKSQEGVVQGQSFIRRGVRVSNNQAFIKPIRHRKNLVVKTDSEVRKVLIDCNKRAYGVKYVRNGKEFTAKARKEVIVSAGAIDSPKLLLLSGIGPAKYLRNLGIKVLQNLSVGENLQDHATFNGFTIYFPNNTLVSNDEILDEIKEYHDSKLKSGPLTGDGVGKVLGFLASNVNSHVPDVQYQFEGVRLEEYLKETITYNAVNILPAAYYNAIVARVQNLKPKSRGRVVLNGTHPYDKPLIYANYLKEPEDFMPSIRGSRFLLGLKDTVAFKRSGAIFIYTKLEDCKHCEFGSDEYIICLNKHYTSTTYHASGTCKMGPATDSEAVVDAQLRVYGIKGLRVIDASIMPVIVGGNTNAAAGMIGERGVQFILDYWLEKW